MGHTRQLETIDRVSADRSGESHRPGSFFPIPVCSTGVGTLELLEVATRGFPSPMEHPLPEVSTPQGVPQPDWPVTMTRRCSPRW